MSNNLVEYDQGVTCLNMMQTSPPGFNSLASLPRTVISARYGTDDNFTKEVLPGYAQDLWLVEEAALALKAAAEELLDGPFGFVVWDGYRPRRATLAMIEWARKTGQMWLVEEGYIARRSRHNGGAAVDLSLIVWDTQELLDMGTEWDVFEETSHVFNAQGSVLQNRLLLRDLMTRHGWVGYEKEWWHFELKNARSFPLRDIPYDKEASPEDPSIC
ncbi:MAG: peptidase M15 [Proteobacteria bacterium]|nr:peptidase M15 [Pseudomonadota bacterium]